MRGEYENVKTEEHTGTFPNTQQNPFLERMNRSILEPTHVMLEQAGLSRKYWELAAEYTNYIKNSLTHWALECSPFEKMTGNRPSLKNIRIFECAAFALNDNPNSKVHATAQLGLLLGCNGHGTYKVELLASKRTVDTVYLTFDETAFPNLENTDSSSSGEEGQRESARDTDSNSNATSEESDDYNIFSTDFRSTVRRRPIPSVDESDCSDMFSAQFGGTHNSLESESRMPIPNNEASSNNQPLERQSTR